MHVFGHEHYAEDLEDLACAGVPIQHPVTGKTVGAIDLTCWRKDAGSLLIALAKTTADNIRAALLNDSSPRELALLQAYLQSSRRLGDMVLAVDDDLLLMNAKARQSLDTADQRAVLGHAVEMLARGGSDAVVVELPTGSRVRITCRPVPVGGTRWCRDHPGQPADCRTGRGDAGRRPPPAAASGPARAGRPQCALARQQP